MAIRFHCPRQSGRPDLCPARDLYSCLSEVQEQPLGRERLARRYAAGEALFHSETPALAVFSVHSGLVRLSRPVSDGHEVVIGMRGPGELLGVRAVLSGLPHNATARTLEPSIVCAVSRETFLQAIHDSPELAINLLRQLAKEALLADEQHAARAGLRVPARTARLLIALMEQVREHRISQPIAISMPREEMALLVGTTRESLSRTLHDLVERGVVKLQDRRIVILDGLQLERIAQLPFAHQLA